MVKLKSIDRSALFCWSPKSCPDNFIAAGTTAQQFDASFSSSSCLELYPVDFSKDDDLKLFAKGVGEVQHRDNGTISIYDPVAIDQQRTPCLITQVNKHKSSVKALHTNYFKSHLLASGAGDSELFIWDLHKPDSPMSPGPVSQPLEQVVDVEWNCRVEHILASVYPGKALVWDLRKSDGPIAKIGELGHRVQWKALNWHPSVPTTLCLASEDDNFPYIQMWDLRFAQSPVLQLEGHQKGVLSTSWSHADPDLLVSCGKDSKIYVWNPNTGEFQAEIPYTGNHWPYSVQWCPRSPNLIGCATFDGEVSVYGLLTRGPAQLPSTLSPKLAESFPDSVFSQQPPKQQTTQPATTKPVLLPKPPKWMIPSCGARFAFGGKLVSFHSHQPDNAAQQNEMVPQSVNIEQVVSDSMLQDEANKLFQVLQSNRISEFCEAKSNKSDEELEKMMWQLMNAYFEKDRRQKSLSILGLDESEIYEKAKHFIGDVLNESQNSSRSTFSASDASNLGDSTASTNLADSFGQLNMNTSTSPESGNGDFLRRSPVKLPLAENASTVLYQSILTDHLDIAVEMSINQGNWTDAILLAFSADNTLFDSTVKRYVESTKGMVPKLAATLLYKRWDIFVQLADLGNWVEALGALLAHVGDQKELAKLTADLGGRLEKSGDPRLSQYAALCYICAGLVDNMVANLSATVSDVNSQSLQNLMEKAFILRSALGGLSQQAVSPGPLFSGRLAKYATLLSQQGCLDMALQYLAMLPDDTDVQLMDLRDRLYISCHHAGLPCVQGMRRPSLPYSRMEVGATSGTRRDSQMPFSATRSRTSSYAQKPAVSLQPSMPYSRGYSTPQPPNPAMHQPSYSTAGYSPMGAGTPAFVAQPHYNPLLAAAQPPPPPSQIDPAIGAPASVASGVGRGRYPSYCEGSAVPAYGYPAYSTPAAPVVQPYSSFQAPVPQPFYHDQPGNIGSSMNMMIPQPPVQQPPLGSQSMRSVPVAAVAPQERGNAPWNDPPPLGPRKTPSRSVVPNDASGGQGHQPITTPFLGQDTGMAGGPPPIGSHPPAQHSYPTASNMQGGVGQNYATQQGSLQPEPTPPSVQRELGPIPNEHVIIQQVLDRFVYLCQSATMNQPQVGRKLEEVSRKLHENLYYLLRTQTLSEQCLHSLHEFVGHLQANDFNMCHGIHSQLVQSADFQAIAAFMPPLKVMLHTASQFGVRYE